MKKLAIRKIILMGVTPIFVVGCTGLSGTQKPAPVYGSTHPYPSQPQVITPPPKPKTTEILQVQPLQDITPITEEPIDLKATPIAPKDATAMPPAMPPSATENASADTPKVIEVSPPTKPLLTPTPPAVTGVPKFEPAPTAPPAPKQEHTEFKPAELSNPMSPAVSALVSAANQSSKSGDLEAAAVSIERAIRIDPRNGELLYKLAVLRIKQSKPVLAEDLAKKSALLADKDLTLKKNSWLLIAHAKEMQGDQAGAAEAREKAASF